MLQTIMFDAKGQPTELAMRYVKPRSYSVSYVNEQGIRCGCVTLDVHKAIGVWLKHIDSKIVTHW